MTSNIDAAAREELREHAIREREIGELELKLLDRLVAPGKNSVDIGANRGAYAYLLSTLSRHVYAYEPHPGVVERLKPSVPDNVSVHPIALSNRAASKTLYVPIRNGTEDTYLSALDRPHDRHEQYLVNTDTLDRQRLRNVGFIKIDVEGHEREVLEGARHTIAIDKPVLLIEIEQRHLAVEMETIFRYVLAFGYDGFFYRGGRLIGLAEFRPAIHQDPRHMYDVRSYINNFIFLPRA